MKHGRPTKVVLAGLLVAAFVAMFAALPMAEDSTLFNCHLHGNHVCGQRAPWHGFTNV